MNFVCFSLLFSLFMYNFLAFMSVSKKKSVLMTPGSKSALYGKEYGIKRVLMYLVAGCISEPT